MTVVCHGIRKRLLVSRSNLSPATTLSPCFAAAIRPYVVPYFLLLSKPSKEIVMGANLSKALGENAAAVSTRKLY